MEASCILGGWKEALDKQVYDGEMGEKEKHSGPCTVERSRTAGVRIRLIWVAYATSGNILI